MGREYKGYRPQIAAINEIVLQQQRDKIKASHPGRTVLKAREVADMEGCKDLRTIKKRYPFDEDGYISVEAYARALCRRFGT